MAALKGKADGELEMSTVLMKSAKDGDAKSALAMLQHAHGWTAKTEISLDVYQKISIIQALEDANQRVINSIIDEAPNRDNDKGLLINNHDKDGYDYEKSNTRQGENSTRL
jgi:hypothetical protein